MRRLPDERTMRLTKFYGQFSRVHKPEDKVNTFATVAPWTCKEGLFSFLYTLSLHNKNATVYVISDKETRDYVENSFVPLSLTLVWDTETEVPNPMQHAIPAFESKEYVEATKSIFLALRWALEKEDSVVYCSPFTVVVDTISIPDFEGPIGVVERGLDEQSTKALGNCSNDFVYVKDTVTLEKWEEIANDDEMCSASMALEKLQREVAFEWLDQSLSLMAERMLAPLVVPESQFDITRSIRAKSKTLRLFLHRVTTVVLRLTDSRIATGIKAITSRMYEANLHRELSISSRAYAGKWYVTVSEDGKSPAEIHLRRSVDHHDEFEIGNPSASSSVMLFNTLSIKEYDDSKDAHSFYDQLVLMRHCLFNPESACLILPIVDIPTNSEDTEAVADTIVDKERGYLVSCSTNDNCSDERTTDLKTICDLVFNENNMDNVAARLVKSKYGLYLDDNAVSSVRLMDLMAVGTVPIIFSKTVVEHAPYPLEENKHYIHCSSMYEVKERLNQIDDQQWNDMSLACRDWYIDHVHSTNFLKNIVNWLLFDAQVLYHRG